MHDFSSSDQHDRFCVIYEIQSGMFEIQQTETFRKWRTGLNDVTARSALARRIERLRFGHVGDARPVGAGVSELRIHCGPGYRVYFQCRGRRIIVLLCAGDKDSQRRDIQKAVELAAQWDQDHD